VLTWYSSFVGGEAATGTDSLLLRLLLLRARKFFDYKLSLAPFVLCSHQLIS